MGDDVHNRARCLNGGMPEDLPATVQPTIQTSPPAEKRLAGTKIDDPIHALAEMYANGHVSADAWFEVVDRSAKTHIDAELKDMAEARTRGCRVRSNDRSMGL